MIASDTERLQALLRLWNLAQGDHGGSMVAAKLLLGLYNGDRFRFDLTELRRLDDAEHRAALLVIDLDSPCRLEVQDWLNQCLHRTDMGPRFELMACRKGIKGRVKRAEEAELRQRLQPWHAEVLQ